MSPMLGALLGSSVEDDQLKKVRARTPSREARIDQNLVCRHIEIYSCARVRSD
jgi:hypothetical protein